MRKEAAVPIIPTAKFGKTSLDVTELWLRQLQCYVVIVEIPQGVAVERKQAIFVKSLLKVQILDPAVNFITREPVFLFKLRAISIRYYSANAEFDPVLVLRCLFGCCCHRFSIRGFASTKCAGGKSSRANQHEESASGAHREI